MCKEAFNAAVDDDLMFKSPWKFKLKNVIKDETVKKKGLTTEETKNLIDLLDTEVVSMRYKDVVLFLLETGMRIGEFCGRTVADFDFIEYLRYRQGNRSSPISLIFSAFSSFRY